MTRKMYTGQEIDVSFDSAICTHSGNCVNGLPAVFDLKARPWVNPDGATKDEVKHLIDRCPSGALQYHEKSGIENE